MAYWLVKSEPGTWSWRQHLDAGVTEWDGVRNFQAANNMKAMRLGDRAFFYHSGAERTIVGIVEVVGEYYPDPTDPTGRFGMVDLKAIRSLDRPVTLKAIKADPRLAELALIRQSRLSVMPIPENAWDIISQLGSDNG